MDDVEVIFEGWLWMLNDARRRSILKTRWKRLYVSLKRVEVDVSLEFYEKKPRSIDEKPKDTLLLNGPYIVEKRFEVKGKSYVCDVVTVARRVSLATDDEKTMHLLAFFIQTHTKLQLKYTTECFVVRPEGTEDQRKIGARGSMCLLHVSPWGLTLALQLSHAVLGQWPLSHIRWYESSEQGQFCFEAGKRSAMGAGRYVFCTRRGHDNEIYDKLDSYIMAASSRFQSQRELSLTYQFEQLHSLTWVFPDPDFSAHLKKVSREIYDQLWQQLDCSKPVQASGFDSSTSPRSQDRHRPGFDNQSSGESLPSTLQKRKSPSYMNSPRSLAESRQTSLAINIRDTPDGSVSRRKHVASNNSNSTVSMDSQYLHMGTPTSPSSPTSINSVLSAFASPVKTPTVQALPETPENPKTVAVKRLEKIGQRIAYSEQGYLEPEVTRREAERDRKRVRARIKSQSCEDLTQYTRMASSEQINRVSNFYSNGDLVDSNVTGSDESQPDSVFLTSAYLTPHDSSHDLPPLSPVTRTRQARERGELPEFSDVKNYFSLKNKKLTRSSSNPTLVEFGLQSRESLVSNHTGAVKPASRFAPGPTHPRPDRPSELNINSVQSSEPNAAEKTPEQNTHISSSPVNANDQAQSSPSPIKGGAISLGNKTKRFRKQKSVPDKKSKSKSPKEKQAIHETGRHPPRGMTVSTNGSAHANGQRKISETLC